MQTFTFSLAGITIEVQARNFFDACCIAGTEFRSRGVDSLTA